jgi:hypothetical protein
MFMANLMLEFYLPGASVANEMNRMSSGCYGNSILGYLICKPMSP